MEITRELLVERIDKYKADIEQMKVTFNAYEGALQDANYWLDLLDKKEEAGS